ncbi:MAG: SDR family NAD(P)-dependent oxidoreductase [Terriglobia bacterium]
MIQPPTLTARVAIITGGGTGIGFGITRVLAEKGVKIALVQRTVEEAEQAVQKLPGTESLAFGADISDPSAVQRMVEDVVDRLGRIDILVNNASVTGMSAIGPILECPPSKVDEIIDVNLKGTFYCSQAVAKRMIAAGRGGNIVHISSVGAYAAQELASLYCATKAGQVAFTRAMALELAPYQIRVNCIAPGDIGTEASSRTASHLKDSGASGRYMRITPLGRRGTPQDIGHAIAYIVSDDAGFITGATLVVDGGFLTY